MKCTFARRKNDSWIINRSLPNYLASCSFLERKQAPFTFEKSLSSFTNVSLKYEQNANGTLAIIAGQFKPSVSMDYGNFSTIVLEKRWVA